MPSFRYTRGEERAFLDTSFEPHGDGFLFYRTHWSKGVPVSAAEREAYLTGPFDGSRRAFCRAIADRAPAAPRRPYGRAFGRMIASFPAPFGPVLLALGGLFLLRALAGDDPPALDALWILAGTAGVLFGAGISLARLLRRGR